MTDSRYRTAFLDWLACAARGRSEPAARAAATLGDPVAAAATAGHVLDFDDTYLPGLAHLSAPSAPAALVVGAEQGRTLEDVLSAYAEGFEAMGAVARAGHPALYDGHYHPTAVCGGVGAAVAAAALLALGEDERDNAVAIALVGAAGLRAAFGSHGKSLQVGLAAASGVRAAPGAGGRARAAGQGGAGLRGRHRRRLRASGGVIAGDCRELDQGLALLPADPRRHRGRDPSGRAARPDGHRPSRLPPGGGLRAPAGGWTRGQVLDPYCTAWTLLHGPPRVESFEEVDAAVCELAERIEVETHAGLLESECVLSADGRELARVQAALGSPGQPMDEHKLAAKVDGLAGSWLSDLVHGRARPAVDVLARVAGS